MGFGFSMAVASTGRRGTVKMEEIDTVKAFLKSWSMNDRIDTLKAERMAQGERIAVFWFGG